MAGAKLGQHFLVNRSAANKIIDFFLPVSGPILEIGPGQGILTHTLLAKTGNQVIAVELDQNLINQFHSIPKDNFRIINHCFG